MDVSELMILVKDNPNMFLEIDLSDIMFYINDCIII